MVMVSPHRITLSAQDRDTLNGWVRAGATPQKLVLRAMIVLLAAGSATIADAARALAIGHHLRSQSSAGSVRSWDTRPSCSQRAGGSQEHAVSAPRATTELRPQKGAHHVDHEPPQRC